MRGEVGDVLAQKERDGVVQLGAPPEVLADLLFAVGDGASMRMLAEPDRDPGPLLAACGDAVRPLLGRALERRRSAELRDDRGDPVARIGELRRPAELGLQLRVRRARRAGRP